MSAASGDEYLVADSSALLAGPVAAPVPVAEPPAAQWPFLLVSVLGVAGMVLIAFGSVRTGLFGLAAALGLAGALRLVLPTTTAGWLASRPRMVDVCVFAILAGSLAAVTVLLVR